MQRNTLAVLIQTFPKAIHPISKKVISTAVKLGREKGYITTGAVFVSKLTDELKHELENSELDEVVIFKDPIFSSFIPENIKESFCEYFKDIADVVLVPATPEGRTVSSQIAATLKTGVTADCTKLEFDEHGLLIQTRPAFSGNIMASIKTQEKRPQIASLRFKSEIELKGKKTKLIYKSAVKSSFSYNTQWLDTAEKEENKQSDIIIAVGAGLNEKDDIEKFKLLAEKLNAQLCSSRMLVDRGWMQRKNQIGLSGNSVSPKVLITFGISGSLQFRAGLENVGKIISVNIDRQAPIMKIADVPIAADLYEVADEMLKILK